MKLTRYEQEIARVVALRYGKLTAAKIVEQLCRMGVIDHRLCKVMAVRRWVAEAIKRGDSKVAAMWRAADYFCVSYEYVRNCMYYYTDVNI